MTILGLPASMFLVFVATIMAGSLGALHYVIVYLIGKRRFEDESDPLRPPAAGEAGAHASNVKR